jgi:hypothetical protein
VSGLVSSGARSSPGAKRQCRSQVLRLHLLPQHHIPHLFLLQTDTTIIIPPSPTFQVNAICFLNLRFDLSSGPLALFVFLQNLVYTSIHLPRAETPTTRRPPTSYFLPPTAISRHPTDLRALSSPNSRVSSTCTPSLLS